MALPYDTATVSVRCTGNAPAGTIGKTKYNILPLTAGNIAGQKSAVTALAAAEGALTEGIIASSDINLNLGKVGGYPATIANRGRKWILSASNPDGRVFTYTIPASLETGQVQSDNYTADFTTTEWAAYKSAFEAVVVDPAANALTLNSAHTGGRRR